MSDESRLLIAHHLPMKGPRPKHIPERTCVACRQKREKRRLTRLVYTPEGLVVDPTGKRNGRGAYLCDQPACWAKAMNTPLLNQALRAQLTAADKEILAAKRPG